MIQQGIKPNILWTMADNQKGISNLSWEIPDRWEKYNVVLNLAYFLEQALGLLIVWYWGMIHGSDQESTGQI